MKGKFFSVATMAISLAIIFTIVLIAMVGTTYGNPGQNPNQNPGSPEQAVGGVTVTVTGGGNNLVIRAICNATGESIIIPRAGNGTFGQVFEAFGYEVGIQVRGNSLVDVWYTSEDNGNGNDDYCDDYCDCDDCKYEYVEDRPLPRFTIWLDEDFKPVWVSNADEGAFYVTLHGDVADGFVTLSVTPTSGWYIPAFERGVFIAVNGWVDLDTRLENGVWYIDIILT